MTKLHRLKQRLIAAGLTVDDVRLQNVGPERVPIMDALADRAAAYSGTLYI